MTAEQFWRARAADVQPGWWDAASADIQTAEPLRALAKFNTGSISMTCAVALRALGYWAKPAIIVEVGTFIGVSTQALARSGATVYTCDISNDCLASTDRIHCHPYEKSTQMLDRLRVLGVTVDLWFFDGLLSTVDIKAIRALSAPTAVYVFDDYNGAFKGVQNVAKLAPGLSGYHLFPVAGPLQRDTTLAVLVPEARL